MWVATQVIRTKETLRIFAEVFYASVVSKLQFEHQLESVELLLESLSY